METIRMPEFLKCEVFFINDNKLQKITYVGRSLQELNTCVQDYMNKPENKDSVIIHQEIFKNKPNDVLVEFINQQENLQQVDITCFDDTSFKILGK